MSQKLMPRLGSAIASTILSVFWAVSLVGVDKAQAATLTYNINGSNLSFLKVNTSSLTGIGEEYIPVSEGKLYDYTLGDWRGPVPGAKEYYDLAGFNVQFYQGEFRGLQALGSDHVTLELRDGPDEIYGLIDYSVAWWISPYPSGTPLSVVSWYWQTIYYPSQDVDRRVYNDEEVYYTLVGTEPEPVPEPLTAGGTALALVGLSLLKHKKKMAA